MKKIIIFILLLVVGLNLVGCETAEISYFGDEVILDKNMEKGIGILGVVSIEDLREIKRYFRYSDTVPKNERPLWTLGQWATKYDFKDTGVERVEGDFFVISDETKEFRVNPNTGQYSLNTFTALEYPEPREFYEPWLHFITAQNIIDNARLDEMNHIWADLDFEITEGENLMGESFNPNLHTALFQWVFIVRNENQDSPDYGNYIWVNIPYYDWRYDFSDEAAFLDGGKEDRSNTFIYSADVREMLDNKPVVVGERRRVVIDLKKYIEYAIEKVKTLPENINSQFPILQNSELSDLRIEQFYIGWEVPGTFNASVTIYSNSLKYDRK